jgi:hypothetical protein
MDETACRGIVVLTRQEPDEMDRSLQNAVRVAVAWHLAATGSGVLLHAAAVADGDRAVVFVGPSGAGKTTVVGLSAPRAVLADDVALVTTTGGRTLVHETPLWAQPGLPHRAPPGTSLPMGALVRLRIARSHSIEALSPAAARAAVLAHAPFLAPAPGAAADLGGIPAAILSFAQDGGFWPHLAPWLDTHRRADLPQAAGRAGSGRTDP